MHQTTSKIENSKYVFLSNRESPKGEFDIFLSDLYDTNQINLTKDIHFVRSISKPMLSPNKRHVLYISFNKNQKSLHLIDLETKEDIFLSDLKMDKAYASFIENGDKILFTKKIEKVMQLFMIDVNGLNEKKISSTNNNEYKPQISSNHKILVFLRKVNKKTFIVIHDLITKKEDSIEVNGNYINPSFNNDNKIIYESFIEGSYKLFIYDIKTKHSVSFNFNYAWCCSYFCPHNGRNSYKILNYLLCRIHSGYATPCTYFYNLLFITTVWSRFE